MSERTVWAATFHGATGLVRAVVIDEDGDGEWWTSTVDAEHGPYVAKHTQHSLRDAYLSAIGDVIDAGGYPSLAACDVEVAP